MLTTIFATEARVLRSDGLAVVTIGLFLAILAYAGIAGARHATEQRAVLAAHTEELDTRVASLRRLAAEAEAEMVRDGISLDSVHLSVRTPYALGTAHGRVVTLDPGPLAAFAVGQTDLRPYAFQVTVAGVRPLGITTTLENPFRLLVGQVDLAFVFLVLYPLLILALTFGLTSAEREAGRLRLLLAQPVSLGTLAAGKLLVRAAVLLGCAVLGTGAVLVATNDGGVGRWGLWLLVTVLYGAFWMALAAFVDSRVGRPATGALVLASVWLGLAVVVPALLSTAASALFPLPSRMAYAAAQRTEASLAQQQSEASLARFFGDHPELAPDAANEADYYMLSVARDARVAVALAPIEADFAAQIGRQHQLVRTLGYLSPTILAQRAFLDVAGTGPARYDAFRDQVDRFQRVWSDHFVPMYFTRVPLAAAAYDAVPSAVFTELSPGDLLARLAGPLVALLLASGVLATAAARRYARDGGVA